MKKSSIFFFTIIMIVIVFLYNTFPLDNKVEISPGVKEEEVDPMHDRVIKRPLTESISPKKEGANEEIEEEFKKKEEERKKIEAEELERNRKAEEELKNKEELERGKKNFKNKEKIKKIIKYAKSKLGKSYKMGGTTDEGYDCSGLIMSAHKKYNIKLPRASYEMANRGRNISKKNARMGDLIFFATKPNYPKRVSHVGMITAVKNGEIFFIHSSSKAGVILNSLNQGYYKKRVLKIKRNL